MPKNIRLCVIGNKIWVTHWTYYKFEVIQKFQENACSNFEEPIEGQILKTNFNI